MECMSKGSTEELPKKIFELTLALYRVTDFFPQGEALCKHLREKANEVFGGISEYSYTGDDAERMLTLLLGKIESIKGFLNIAKAFRFVNPINFMVLEKEYIHISEMIKNERDSLKDIARIPQLQEKRREKADEGVAWSEFVPQREVNSDRKHIEERKGAAFQKERVAVQKKDLPTGADGVNERQKKIIAHLREVNQAKISDFYSSFSEISSKTIQRDLQDLVSKNLLKKDGEKRWTVYTINVQ